MADVVILDPHHIQIPHDGTVHTTNDFRLSADEAADVPIAITEVNAQADKFILTTASILDTRGHYTLSQINHATWHIAPSMLGMLISIILTSALIQNFVFTRYLGLCVFFGVSRKKETAIGMGVTFTIVGILSGLLSWIINQFAMKPLHLHFLEIIVFIGIIACIVQMTDTIMKKLNRVLHRKFGIYVMLITTNCIILAVPLLNAMNGSSMAESLALAIGSGLGFALALFLMSCAREKSDLSPVPAVFKGMPIAFILAGLFALAFMGFSGLKV